MKAKIFLIVSTIILIICVKNCAEKNITEKTFIEENFNKKVFIEENISKKDFTQEELDEELLIIKASDFNFRRVSRNDNLFLYEVTYKDDKDLVKSLQELGDQLYSRNQCNTIILVFATDDSERVKLYYDDGKIDLT